MLESAIIIMSSLLVALTPIQIEKSSTRDVGVKEMREQIFGSTNRVEKAKVAILQTLIPLKRS
jgi:hypothetical protein